MIETLPGAKCDGLSATMVAGDKLWLSQVLVNMVSNALKFTPAGGNATLEASRAIRNHQKDDGKAVPIIGLSANAFREDVDKAIQSGMNGYLSKPIDKTKLLETVQRFL